MDNQGDKLEKAIPEQAELESELEETEVGAEKAELEALELRKKGSKQVELEKWDSAQAELEAELEKKSLIKAGCEGS